MNTELIKVVPENFYSKIDVNIMRKPIGEQIDSINLFISFRFYRSRYVQLYTCKH